MEPIGEQTYHFDSDTTRVCGKNGEQLGYSLLTGGPPLPLRSSFSFA